MWHSFWFSWEYLQCSLVIGNRMTTSDTIIGFHIHCGLLVFLVPVLVLLNSGYILECLSSVWIDYVWFLGLFSEDNNLLLLLLSTIVVWCCPCFLVYLHFVFIWLFSLAILLPFYQMHLRFS